MVDSILPKGFVLEKTNNTTLPEGFVLEKENIVESNIIEKEPNDLFTGIKNFFAMPEEKPNARGFDQVKELWQSPLGLSEKSIKESRNLFGDPNTILGQFNSTIIEGGVKYGDLALRTVATPFVYGTGVVGDIMEKIEKVIDITPFSPKTAGDKFTQDLNALLMSTMGLGRGTFRPSTIKKAGKEISVVENIKTGEIIEDPIAYARRSGRTKEEVIRDVKKALEEDIARIKREDIAKQEQKTAIDTRAAEIETNVKIANAQRQGIPIDTVKPKVPETPKRYNFASAVDDALSRKDLDVSPRITRDNLYQRQVQKGLDYVYNTVGYKIAPLGQLPRKQQYLKARYGTFGKLLQVDKVGKKVFDSFKNLTPDVKDQVFSYLTNKTAKSDIIIDPITRNNAIDVKTTIEKIGNELVKRKLLPQQVIDQNKGSYLPRLYLKYLNKPTSLGYTKGRKDLSDEEKLILGEITDPTILAPTGITQPTRDMVFMDFLNELGQADDWVYQPSLVKYKDQKVSPIWLKEESQRIQEQLKTANNFFNKEEKQQLQNIADEMDQLATENIALQRNLPEAKSGEVTKYFTQLPNNKKFGTMAGAYVRKEIANDLVNSYDIVDNVGAVEQFFGRDGFITKANQLWKMNKVVLNPPTQIRNFVSNMILMNLSGVDARKVPLRIIEAAKDIYNDGPYYNIAIKYGLPQTTFSNRELFKLTTEFERLVAKNNKPENAISLFAQMGYKLIDNPITRTAQEAYQFSETLGKVAKIIDEMKKGSREADAVLAAQEALFDYSLVPKGIEFLRRNPLGSPFITFQYKAAPRMLESLLKRPHRFLPYLAIPTAMSAYIASEYEVSFEDVEKLKKVLPEFIRDKGSAFIMPVKDSYGRWQALDFSYFLPYSMLVESAIQTKDLATTGDLERLGELSNNAGLFGGFLPQLITALSSNIDPFTERPIYNPSDPNSKQLSSIMTYLWNLAMPSFMTDLGVAGKLKSYIEGEVDYYGDPKLDLTQSLLRGVGVNLYPIDPTKQRNTNLYFMQQEIKDIVYRKKQILKDKNLNKEEKEKINNQYNKLIEERQEQIQEYMKESEVPEELKIQNN